MPRRVGAVGSSSRWALSGAVSHSGGSCRRTAETNTPPSEWETQERSAGPDVSPLWGLPSLGGPVSFVHRVQGDKEESDE